MTIIWPKGAAGKEFLVYRRPVEAKPEPAPIAEWDGTGLPPIGAVCEHQPMDGGKDWVEVKILAHAEAHDGAVAVFQFGNEVAFSSARCFRPIRAPEQIAAEEREKAIEEMHRLYVEGAKGHIGGLAAIYDAGYRKVGGDA